MDNPAQLREQVQKAIVDVITSNLESGAMTESRAKEIAKYVLEMLPENISFPKLIEVIPRLDDEFQELATVVVPLMSAYEKQVKKTVSAQISKLMQEGKLDEALNLAKKAIVYDQNLS
jgi:Ni,Fe-hydrogenase maturation factor